MIQNFFSKKSGKFCIYFIGQRSKNVSLHDLVNVFSNDLKNKRRFDRKISGIKHKSVKYCLFYSQVRKKSNKAE